MPRRMLLIGLLAILCVPGWAREMKPLEEADLIVVEREIEGKTEQEAINEAARLAVQSCVGRIYFSDKLIMARSLLEKYLNNYYEKFVFSTVVVDKKHLGDKVQLQLKTFVNYSKLIEDLEAKRFLFKPRVRPFFLVFVKETLDGAPAPYQHGHEIIRTAWKDITGQREPEGELIIPPSNLDVSESRALLDEAIRAAQKKESEIILTGTCSSIREKREELYYDTYTFYRTEVNLKLIRADTKEVLDQTTVSSLAGSARQKQAIELSITRAARKAVNRLAEFYNQNWDKMIHKKGDYVFLFTGVMDEKLDIIKKHLSALSDDAQVYVKSRFADVAVVNLIYKGDKELLIVALEELAYPRMHILRSEDNQFEIQIKN